MVGFLCFPPSLFVFKPRGEAGIALHSQTTAVKGSQRDELVPGVGA